MPCNPLFKRCPRNQLVNPDVTLFKEKAGLLLAGERNLGRLHRPVQLIAKIFLHQMNERGNLFRRHRLREQRLEQTHCIWRFQE